MPIGDEKLIAARSNFILSNGKRLGKYIPFYFASRTPMLYVIQNGFNMVAPIGPEKIIYCVTSVHKIIDLKLDFVFTDGHAVDSFSTLYYPENIYEIETILDWEALKAKYWKDENDLDRKRRKEAEFLVESDIDIAGVLGYVVYNQNAKDYLEAQGVNEMKIKINPNYYF